MAQIDLLVEDCPTPSWLSLLEEYVVQLVTRLGEENWEMSLTLCSDSYIADLNSRYRSKEGPTDVLTFVMDEGDEVDFPGMGDDAPRAVGDIVVSLDRVKENAREAGIGFDEELKRVILHGVLHLKGMTHEGYDWSQGMLKEQEILLKDYGEIRFTN